MFTGPVGPVEVFFTGHRTTVSVKPWISFVNHGPDAQSQTYNSDLFLLNCYIHCLGIITSEGLGIYFMAFWIKGLV